MRQPKLTSVNETHRGRQHLATLTLEVPIEDLDRLVDHLDLTDAPTESLDAALEASKHARDRLVRDPPPADPTQPAQFE